MISGRTRDLKFRFYNSIKLDEAIYISTSMGYAKPEEQHLPGIFIFFSILLPTSVKKKEGTYIEFKERKFIILRKTLYNDLLI